MTALLLAAIAFSAICFGLAFASYLIDHRRSARHVDAIQPIFGDHPLRAWEKPRAENEPAPSRRPGS